MSYFGLKPTSYYTFHYIKNPNSPAPQKLQDLASDFLIYHYDASLLPLLPQGFSHGSLLPVLKSRLFIRLLIFIAPDVEHFAGMFFI